MIKKCNTCGLRDSKQNKCLLSGASIDPTADFCSKHNNNPIHCCTCGVITLRPLFETTSNGEVIAFCPQCGTAATYCPGCSHSNECSFETDPSPIPKYIMKTSQKGPMITQMQVRNPDRIANTCMLNCQCWSGSFCCREDNWCTNYLSRHSVVTDYKAEKLGEDSVESNS